MEKLHYKTLQSAVAKYGGLEGSEDEIKAAIAADEKKFTPEQVEEIYQAIASPAPPPPEKKPEAGKFLVAKEFRDANDFSKRHSEGDDVSHFEKDRLAHLVEIGYVKKV